MSDLNHLAWKPTADLTALRRRAEFIQSIRQFFYSRNVLEVETPLLCQFGVTDPYIKSFTTRYENDGDEEIIYYLQTSPEYAMKRLLAAGSGPIFQICKAFRNGEYGNRHNPEFSMLEWYRPGFNHMNLIDEVDEFLQTVCHFPPARKISYREFFLQCLNFDPMNTSKNELLQLLDHHHINVNHAYRLDEADCLDLLFDYLINDNRNTNNPIFIYDFPQSHAALAKIRNDDTPVAERFECFFRGSEIANGFHELCDYKEQFSRFLDNQTKRLQQNLPAHKHDHRLISALYHGLPDCAGVAVGVDRLLMIILSALHIQQVISFDWEMA